MNLVEECRDMLELLFSDEENPIDYQIVENYPVCLCPEQAYAVVDEVNFEECQQCKMKDECGKKIVFADLYIFVPMWAGDDDHGSYYINFNKKPENEGYREGITYLNTRRQLIDFMRRVKIRIDHQNEIYVQYVENILELKKYSKEFLQEVKNDLPVFADISSDLPISFELFSRKNKDGGEEYNIKGDVYQVDKSQINIHIYNCWEYIESLKKTLRHEILHYVLMKKGLNYSDDAAFFHYLCQLYDAGAYKEMPEREKNIFKELLKKGSVGVNALFEEEMSTYQWAACRR